VRRLGGLNTIRLQPVAKTGVDQRVINDQVAAPGQGGSDGGIGGKPGGKIKRGLAAKETGGFLFQRFVLGMIAAQ